MENEVVPTLFASQKSILIALSFILFLILKRRKSLKVTSAIFAVTIGMTLPPLVFSVVVLFMGIKNFLLKRKIDLSLFISVLVLQFYLFLNTIKSQFFTGEQLTGMFEQLIYLSFFIFIIMELTSIKKAFDIIDSFMLYSIVISLIALYELALSYITDKEIVRVSSILGSPNTLGLYAAVNLILAVIFIFDTTKIHNRKFYNRVLVLNTITLLFSMSRAAWVAVVVVLGLIIILPPKKLKLRYLILIVLSIILIPLIIPDDIKFMISMRIQSMFDPNDLSSNDRITMIQSAFIMIKEHPFFGNGFRTFPEILQRISIVLNSAKINHPHNTYLELLQTNGFVGLALYAFPILYVFPKAKIKKNYMPEIIVLKRAMNWVILMILIYGFFDRVFFTIDVAIIFWLALGIRFKLPEFYEN